MKRETKIKDFKVVVIVTGALLILGVIEKLIPNDINNATQNAVETKRNETEKNVGSGSKSEEEDENEQIKSVAIKEEANLISKVDVTEEEQNYLNYVTNFLNNPIQARVTSFLGRHGSNRLPQIKNRCGDTPTSECMYSTLADIGSSLYLDYYDLILEFENTPVPLKFKDLAKEQRVRNSWYLYTIYNYIMYYQAIAKGDKIEKLDDIGLLFNLNINAHENWPMNISNLSIYKPDTLEKSKLIQPDRGVKFDELQPPPYPKPKEVNVLKREGNTVILWEFEEVGMTYAVDETTIRDIGNYRQAEFATTDLLREEFSTTHHIGEIIKIEVDCKATPYEYRFIYKALFYKNKKPMTQDNLSSLERKLRNVNSLKDEPENIVVYYICQYGENLDNEFELSSWSPVKNQKNNETVAKSTEKEILIEEKTFSNTKLNKDNLGEYRKAIQDYNTAIELNPNDAIAYYKRAYPKHELGDNNGALQDLNKVIELNPTDTEAYNFRGNVKAEVGDYKESIQDYNKAIELNPNDASPYSNRGITKSDLGDYRGALQDLNKAIELNPNYAEAYINRGLAKMNLSQKDSGCLDLSKAGELGLSQAYDYIKQYCPPDNR